MELSQKHEILSEINDEMTKEPKMDWTIAIFRIS